MSDFYITLTILTFYSTTMVAVKYVFFGVMMFTSIGTVVSWLNLIHPLIGNNIGEDENGKLNATVKTPSPKDKVPIKLILKFDCFPRVCSEMVAMRGSASLYNVYLFQIA